MGLFDFDFLGDIFSDVGSSVSDAASGAATAVSDAASSAGSGLSGVADSVASGAGKAADTAGDWASKLWGGAGDVAGGFGKFAKGALPFAQIGAAGLGIANSFKAQDAAAENNKRIKEAFALQERAAVPLTNYGESQLRAAQAGEVPPAIQAGIDRWKQGALAKARDYLARAGNSDSSAMRQWEDYINAQAEEMKGAALRGESQQGIDALGKGAGVAAGVGNQAGQQQTSLEQLIAAANSQLGRLSGAAA